MASQKDPLSAAQNWKNHVAKEKKISNEWQRDYGFLPHIYQDLAKTQQNTYAKTKYAHGARPGLSEYAEHFGSVDNVKLPVLNLSVRLPSLTTTGDYGRQIPVEDVRHMRTGRGKRDVCAMLGWPHGSI